MIHISRLTFELRAGLLIADNLSCGRKWGDVAEREVQL